MKVQIPKLSKHVEPNLSKRLEYKNKKILRQCSILAVNFWSVTYFGVFNFGTSYLGAKMQCWCKKFRKSKLYESTNSKIIKAR
jgi:hypothetical protein